MHFIKYTIFAEDFSIMREPGYFQVVSASLFRYLLVRRWKRVVGFVCSHNFLLSLQ